MEHVGSILNSQELSTCSYPEPDQSSHINQSNHISFCVAATNIIQEKYMDILKDGIDRL
jgi:hypothetical protein